MTRSLIAIVVWLAVALPVWSETVVMGLSQDEVAITATFDGSDILIFGAVKRDRPAPKAPLDVVITISGPSEPVILRRKSRVFGIWVNTGMIHVDSAPSYYAVASTGPLRDTLSETENLRHRITLDHAIRAVGVTEEAADADQYVAALKRIRQEAGQYTLREGAIALDQQTLFRMSLALPANLTEGDYSTRIFLTRGGQVVDLYETSIAVQKVGLERWLFSMARDRALLYGLMSLVIAIAAGWGASAGFGLIFRR